MLTACYGRKFQHPYGVTKPGWDGKTFLNFIIDSNVILIQIMCWSTLKWAISPFQMSRLVEIKTKVFIYWVRIFFSCIDSHLNFVNILPLVFFNSSTRLSICVVCSFCMFMVWAMSSKVKYDYILLFFNKKTHIKQYRHLYRNQPICYSIFTVILFLIVKLHFALYKVVA